MDWVFLLFIMYMTFLFGGRELIGKFLENRRDIKQKELELKERHLALEEQKELNTRELLDRLPALEDRADLAKFDDKIFRDLKQRAEQ